MKSFASIAAACWLLGGSVCAQAPAEATPTPVPAEAAASPTSAATTPMPAAENSHVLYPASNEPVGLASARSTGDPSGMPGLAMSFLVLLALCGGGFYLLRRPPSFSLGGKAPRKLLVSESRSLGNRQFLVVVEYESERVLLGITPGKIDYLCPLPIKGEAT